MNDYVLKSQTSSLPPVEDLSDEQIRAYLPALAAEDTRREKRRKREAIAELHRKAREAGLVIDSVRTRKKTGRRKAKP